MTVLMFNFSVKTIKVSIINNDNNNNNDNNDNNNDDYYYYDEGIQYS